MKWREGLRPRAVTLAVVDFVDGIDPPRFDDLGAFAGIALAKKMLR